MKPLIIFCVLLLAACISSETPAEQCEGQEFDNLQERIQITPCGKSRCKLTKGTVTTVTFKFKPKTVVKSLTNDVYADIAGLPLPFLGVTGSDACPNVKKAEDGSPAPCPLQPDQEYVYTNTFPIESYYPQVNLRVHWALREGNHDVICFEVPAVIAPGKKKAKLN
ncbi:NPC intracellular cholesterol transporter 2 [Pieris rapae]|uniref:NPC intracellular cholesterol transporter 2 n=1 Tax=Pieris rapae TaxID=64459 RepID=UPI001E2813A4|nr:NPC intracellular cholesterol transporter 2 [Pieris rapae]